MKVNKQQKPFIKMMRLHPDVQLPVTNFIHVVYVSFLGENLITTTPVSMSSCNLKKQVQTCFFPNG